MNRIKQFVNTILSAVRKFVDFVFYVIRNLVISVLSALCSVQLSRLISNDYEVMAFIAVLGFSFIFLAFDGIWGIIRKPDVKYYYTYMLGGGVCGTLGFFSLATCVAMNLPKMQEILLVLLFLIADICGFIFICLGILRDDRSAV